MQSPLRTLTIVWLAALAAAHAGCAGTRPQGPLGKGPLGKLNLPSPWDTVKASQAKAEEERSASTARQAANEPTAVDGQLALDLLRGRGLERSGDFDKARKLYEGLRQQHPQCLEVVHRLGVVADAERRHAEAEGMFQYVLREEPQNAEVLADLGYCYFLQGQLIKAESALLKAVAVGPSNPRYRNNLGLVIGHQGRPEEALDHFRAAGSEADAYYNLAFIYATQEQADKAKRCFLMALNEDPTHGKAREALRSFEEYERLPEGLRQDDMLAEGRVKYVPYIEPADAGRHVQRAVLETSLPTSRDVSQAMRSMHTRSRGMLSRNMQSQRSDPPVELVQE